MPGRRMRRGCTDTPVHYEQTAREREGENDINEWRPATRRSSSSSRLTTMPSGARVLGSYSMIMPLCPPSTAPSRTQGHVDEARCVT